MLFRVTLLKKEKIQDNKLVPTTAKVEPFTAIYEKQRNCHGMIDEKQMRMKKTRKIICPNFGTTPIHVFDFIVICLHLSAFILFNLIYYTQHLS